VSSEKLRTGRALLAEAGRRLRREDGQSLVEFAVVLPVLLMLVTGIIQFGLLFNKYLTLTDAVRTGAQTLALGRGLSDPCDPAVAQTLSSASATGLTSGEVTLSFTAQTPPPTPAPTTVSNCGTGTYPSETGGNENQGDQATVTAAQPFTLAVFGLPLFSLNLSASASDAVQ
jgi:Flp pilus assembly protein TadG